MLVCVISDVLCNSLVHFPIFKFWVDFRPPPEPIIPNLAARRSTIVRTARKSMCESSLSRDDGGTTSSQHPENSAPKGSSAGTGGGSGITAERHSSLTPQV